MHHRFATLLAAALSTAALSTATLSAQVQPGDIGVVGFSPSAFGVATPPNVTSYTTSGFQGTGTAQAILHDPTAFNDFLVGGFGFIGRATITGPGLVNYTLITNGIGTASQMSWDNAGNIIVADAGTDQVRMVTPAGVVSDLSIGAQPWGANVNAGAFELTTGDVIVGGNGGLYRLPFGQSTAVPITTGLGGFVSGVTFDPVSGDIFATVLTVSRIVRVTAAGLVTDFAPAGTVAAPNSLDVDTNGDLIVGGNAGAIYRVPLGGPASLLATNPTAATSAAGVSVAKPNGGGFTGSFGSACNATAGPATLTAAGIFAVGQPFTTTSVNHQPLAIGLTILGLSDTLYGALPLPFLLDPVLGTSNCFLNVSADLTVVGFTSPSGTLDFTLVPTPSFAGQRLFLQHTVLEAVPGGFSFSNGVFVQF